MKIKPQYSGKLCDGCKKPITTGSKTGKCKKCTWDSYKEKRVEKECKTCHNTYPTYPCRLHTQNYCSRQCRILANVGRKMPRDAVRRSAIGHAGEKSHFWKGGITKKNKLIRGSYRYKHWREDVFKKDDYTCQDCGVRGTFLHAHHIKSFADYPEFRFDVSNGQTLCVECHKKTDSYLFKYKKKDVIA